LEVARNSIERRKLFRADEVSEIFYQYHASKLCDINGNIKSLLEKESEKLSNFLRFVVIKTFIVRKV
jgi:hypothetical protein